MKLFLTSAADEVMDKIVPLLTKKPSDSKLAFVPTAADPYEDKWFVDDDRKKLEDLGFKIVDLPLRGKTEADLEKVLSEVDIIFVGGGNTFYLLEQSKKSGFAKLVKKLVNQGVIYIGSSAGSVLLAPDIEPIKYFDDPSEAQLDSPQALGLVDFVPLPHYQKEKYNDLHEKVLKEYSSKYQFVPITDQQFILVDEKGYKII